MMDEIRASAATASLLGLREWAVEVMPTTLYFMLGDECRGACAYCTQGRDFLSRVRWPSFPINNVADRLGHLDGHARVGRICIQSLYYRGVVDDIVEAAGLLGRYGIPVSVSMNPVGIGDFERIRGAGVERVGIGLDCCTRELFSKWKKNVPSWDEYMKGLDDAKRVFGNSTAHIIIGLGESDEEAVGMIDHLYRKGIDVALFSYTPVRGGSPPPVGRYHAIQLARYLIAGGMRTGADFSFEDGRLAEMEFPEGIEYGNAFLTSGCPSCNRPFYNERVSGPMYNYPRRMGNGEIEKAIEEVKKYVRVYTSAP